MLHGPIGPTVLRLAWPNVLMMLSLSATSLIEAWYVSRLGTDALAAMALVLPVLMLMQNMSQGAMGGGISAAVARALGSGKQALADRLVMQAVMVNGALGLACTVVLLVLGPRLYRALGAEGAALSEALHYSNVIFGGIVLMWIMNALASAIRGTGNMLVPGSVICGGALMLIPLSPCLIFGFGPIPAMGIAGAGLALLIYYGAGALILGWYCASGRNAARLRLSRADWSSMRDILRVGGLATINPFLNNGTIALSTALVGIYFGTAAVAGYGVGVRVEYLVIPIAFGFGAPLVALVGSNLGAGQPERARRIALTGGAMAFVAGEVIGVIAAIWPEALLSFFGANEALIESGSTYLRIVGPFYGFFALGFSLYFASQGAGRLKWPLIAGLLRLVVAVGLGGWALHVTGSLAWFFVFSSVAMVVYATIVTTSVYRGWSNPR